MLVLHTYRNQRNLEVIKKINKEKNVGKLKWLFTGCDKLQEHFIML